MIMMKFLMTISNIFSNFLSSRYGFWVEEVFFFFFIGWRSRFDFWWWFWKLVPHCSFIELLHWGPRDFREMVPRDYFLEFESAQALHITRYLEIVFSTWDKLLMLIEARNFAISMWENVDDNDRKNAAELI